MYIIVCRPERNVRATLMPGKWRGGDDSAGGRGAVGGAVCAALVGAAHAPPPSVDLTPSTDLSTLNDPGECTSGIPPPPLSFHM